MLATPELEIARRLPRERCAVAEAQLYTRWLAHHHYENFRVVSRLLPRPLHQHFYNLYAYCRWSDDLGDEIANPGRALKLLDAWEQDLRKIYSQGQGPSHPVLIALRETIRAKNIPPEPFTDLLCAFRQDQVVHRYRTWDDVLGYCVYSANPVGRLVLYLCGYSDESRQRLSDHTCTALQLANFWQDVSRDLEKGRIYVPLEALAEHGLTENDIIERRFDARYVELMKALISRTRQIFAGGLPLAQCVDPALRIDVELFSRGGLAILKAIESCGYDTLHSRPVLSKWTQLHLLGRALATRAVCGLRAGQTEVRTSSPTSAGVDGAIPAPRQAASTVWAGSETLRASYAECNRIARAAHSSFYMAFFGLRKEKRNALFALYAFMRLVDNISDEPGDLEAKRRQLARWRAMLDEASAGQTGAHPILPALSDSIVRFEIPTRYFHDLILGAEMDLTVASYATFDRLSEYCYRVAGTVGITCLHVFGFRDSRDLDLAESLGLAFQLTNIIRDVSRDFEMGRTYIPQDDLARFGCSSEDLRGPLTPQLHDLLEFEANRAWRLYDQGGVLVDRVSPDSHATLWALVRTYSALLAQIEESGFDVFSSRVALSSAEKIQYLLVAGMSGWWKRDALAKRSGDRRRSGRAGLRRRAG